MDDVGCGPVWWPVGVDLVRAEGQAAVAAGDRPPGRGLARRAAPLLPHPPVAAVRHRPARVRRPDRAGGRRCAGDGTHDPRDPAGWAGPASTSTSPAANRGMFELMFRHDLLRERPARPARASLPLFGVAGRPGRPGAGPDGRARARSSPARSGPTCTASPSSGAGAACSCHRAPTTTTRCCAPRSTPTSARAPGPRPPGEPCPCCTPSPSSPSAPRCGWAGGPGARAGAHPRHGGAILAGNHLSVADELFLVTVDAPARRLLGQGRVLHRPGVRAAGSTGGSSPAWAPSRSTAPAAGPPCSALDAAVPVLRAGGLVAVYPEGTRSPDGRLYRGRTGMTRLARDAGVPIIPVGVLGTAEVPPVDARLPRRHPITPAVRPADHRRRPDHRTARHPDDHRRADGRDPAAHRPGVRAPLRPAHGRRAPERGRRSAGEQGGASGRPAPPSATPAPPTPGRPRPAGAARSAVGEQRRPPGRRARPRPGPATT